MILLLEGFVAFSFRFCSCTFTCLYYDFLIFFVKLKHFFKEGDGGGGGNKRCYKAQGAHGGLLYVAGSHYSHQPCSAQQEPHLHQERAHWVRTESKGHFDRLTSSSAADSSE